MELVGQGRQLPPAHETVILLDTNAVIWLEQNHPRSLPLLRTTSRLYVSPATVLELQFLLEAGRIRLRDATVDSLISDERWMLDDPPAAKWFTEALESGWTRDPFDRLIVAHARLRNWRLATGDAALAERLGGRRSLVL